MEDTPADIERLLAENGELRRRLDVVADHAHSHARRAVELQRDSAGEVGRLQAELAAAHAELDRVRATPAARAERLARRAGRRVRRAAPAPVVPSAGPSADNSDGASAVPAAPPVVVIVRDRLSCLERLVDWLEDHGVDEIHLVDNDSTYPPLVAYLETSPHRVWRVGGNLGHRAPWIIGIVAELSARGPFVVTDPDVLPAPSCPDDVFEHLARLLDRYPGVDKVGLGLRIDDLPAEFVHRDSVVTWEERFWHDEAEPGVYRAPVDTTFALYRATASHDFTNALRTGPPYVAHHLPWYADSSSPTDEDRYYRARLDPSISTWDQVELSPFVRNQIRERRETSTDS